MRKHTLFMIACIAILLSACDSDFSSNSSDSTKSSNGSYSTMLSIGNKLYTVSKEELTTFDITNRSKPLELNRQDVGFQIENLYHTNGVLFIGSQLALHIYKINDNGIPQKKSSTLYATFGQEVSPCDPVISDGSYAYATLSSRNETGGRCSRTIDINELRTYDVKDLSNPVLASKIEMKNPKGLSIYNDRLFVCEGEDGLKMFDIKHKDLPNLLLTLSSCNCYDIIIQKGIIYAVGKNQIYQYTYGNNSLVQLKTIQL